MPAVDKPSAAGRPPAAKPRPGKDTDVKDVNVPAIARAASVLDVLAKSSSPLTFSQIAEHVSLSKSSLHNICQTLVACGFAERDADGRFQIGLRLVELTYSRIKSMSIVSNFQEACRTKGLASEGAVLSILRGANVVYLSSIPGNKPFSIRYDIGLVLPAAFTASGKAMLAQLTDDAVRDLVGPLASSDLVAAPDKPVARLLEELEQVRLTGFSVDDEETARGMICVGAPVIMPHTGQLLGGVALSTPKHAGVSSGSGLEDMASRVMQLAKIIGEGPYGGA
jgi:DNA-binding IclR family transcriptional regulator